MVTVEILNDPYFRFKCSTHINKHPKQNKTDKNQIDIQKHNKLKEEKNTLFH